MNKKIFISIFSLMMVSSAFFTSCSKEDSFEEDLTDTSKEYLTDTSSWIEPYCTMGSTMDQVKNYMASNMKELPLEREETNSLHYSSDNVGIGYYFNPITGGLYGVVDTEPISKKSIIEKVLKEHYSFAYDPEIDNTYYFNKDKSMVVMVGDCLGLEGYCNVTYSK